MNDPWVLQMFAKTEYIVEASHHSAHCLWREFHPQCNWEQVPKGVYLTLGELSGMPVGVSAMWVSINGHIVMFWEPVSVVFDHRMWQKFRDDYNLRPLSHRGRREAATSASNFHLCLEHCGVLPIKSHPDSTTNLTAS